MSNCIFVGSDFVWAIEYEESTISKSVKLPLPKGCVNDGEIVLMGELTKILSLLKTEHGFLESGLMIDSGKISSISTLVPNLKKLEYQKIAERELRYERGKECSVHYNLLKKNHDREGNVLFALMSPNALIDSYKELFSIAGIRITGIVALEESMDLMCKNLFHDQNFIVSLINGESVYLAFYAQGKRIFWLRGTDIDETCGNFLKAMSSFEGEDLDIKPEFMYILEDRDDVLNNLSKSLETPTKNLATEFTLEGGIKEDMVGPCFLAMFRRGALDLGKNSSDSYEIASKTISPKQKIAFGVLGVSAIIAFGTLVMAMNYYSENKGLNDYLSDSVNVSRYESASLVSEDLEKLEATLDKFKETEDFIGRYNIAQIELMEELDMVASGWNARILGLDFDQAKNVLTASLETKDASSASAFVSELRALSMNIKDIKYGGYEETNEHIYKFLVEITPKDNKQVFGDYGEDMDFEEEEETVDEDAKETSDEEDDDKTGDTKKDNEDEQNQEGGEANE